MFNICLQLVINICLQLCKERLTIQKRIGGEAPEIF